MFMHKDRLWQMELMRRSLQGACQNFWKSGRKNDRFAGLGIEEASDKAIANLDKSSPSYKLMMSYLDGINQFMEEGPSL
jgi:penicillin amidase